MTGHLARLCLEGTGSTGQYTPQAFNLRLMGTAQAVDHIVYLHEVHHAALNDSTAWGSALHVYARLPDAGTVFAGLLDACRIVHESLATFASVQIATARHGEVDFVLDAYPRYVPLYRSTCWLTTGVEGPNRRQQAVTALARVCMQSPVLDVVVGAGLGGFRMAAIREHDRPDARWNWFLRRGPGVLTAAAQAADRVLLDEYGPSALQSDSAGSDLYQATDRSHDDAWDRWEVAVYEHLCEAIAASGVGVVPFDGHQELTAKLLELVHEGYGDLGLRAGLPDQLRHDDAQLAASVLQQVRHELFAGERYRAVVVPLASLDEVVQAVGDIPVAGGCPALIVDARPVDRLEALYRWAPGSDIPPVAVRLIAEDDAGLVIGHVPLNGPTDLEELVRRWGTRGIFTTCVGASCLAAPGFADAWLSVAPRPVFVLVDVEPARFVPQWAGKDLSVVAVPLDVEDPSGHRAALLFSVDGSQIWWLVVADDVTVRLMVEYLRGQLGESLRLEAGALEPVREAAIALITHILATESFTSFDAMESRHAR